MTGLAHSKNPRKCAYHVTFDLELEHTLDALWPGDHRVQVRSRFSHLPGRRSDFHASTKVPVSRDLWHWPWAHPTCTLTWRPSCASLFAIQPFACEKKRFAQSLQTDGQTNRRQTPRHCISSFLEWAKNDYSVVYIHKVRRKYNNKLVWSVSVCYCLLHAPAIK